MICVASSVLFWSVVMPDLEPVLLCCAFVTAPRLALSLPVTTLLLSLSATEELFSHRRRLEVLYAGCTTPLVSASERESNPPRQPIVKYYAQAVWMQHFKTLRTHARITSCCTTIYERRDDFDSAISRIVVWSYSSEVPFSV